MTDIAPAALSVVNAARYLGISRASIYLLIKAGHLPIAKIGHRTLLRRVDLDTFLTRNVVNKGRQEPTK
jgi:excisionase family DNA binding protein